VVGVVVGRHSWLVQLPGESMSAAAGCVAVQGAAAVAVVALGVVAVQGAAAVAVFAAAVMEAAVAPPADVGLAEAAPAVAGLAAAILAVVVLAPDDAPTVAVLMIRRRLFFSEGRQADSFYDAFLAMWPRYHSAHVLRAQDVTV